MDLILVLIFFAKAIPSQKFSVSTNRTATFIATNPLNSSDDWNQSLDFATTRDFKLSDHFNTSGSFAESFGFSTTLLHSTYEFLATERITETRNFEQSSAFTQSEKFPATEGFNLTDSFEETASFEPSPGGSGLGNGAKAALIVLACALAVGACLVIAFFIVRNRQQRSETQYGSDGITGEGDLPEISADPEEKNKSAGNACSPEQAIEAVDGRSAEAAMEADDERSPGHVTETVAGLPTKSEQEVAADRPSIPAIEPDVGPPWKMPVIQWPNGIPLPPKHPPPPPPSRPRPPGRIVKLNQVSLDHNFIDPSIRPVEAPSIVSESSSSSIFQ